MHIFQSPNVPSKTKRTLVTALILGLAVVASYAAYRWYTRPAQFLAAPAVVQITKDGFIPNHLLIKQGQSVAFENHDIAAHRIHGNKLYNQESAAIDSRKPIELAETFTHTFDKPGKYNIQDYFEPTKNITVEVK